MPAYSFQLRFVEPIRAGIKGGTIRAPRRFPKAWSDFARNRRPGGHAIAGEELSLYCRQRVKSGFLIGFKSCIEVEPIVLDFERDEIRLGDDTITPGALNRFARFDGFEDWPDMAGFWRATHAAPQFEGWHIRWLALPLS